MDCWGRLVLFGRAGIDGFSFLGFLTTVVRVDHDTALGAEAGAVAVQR